MSEYEKIKIVYLVRSLEVSYTPWEDIKIPVTWKWNREKSDKIEKFVDKKNEEIKKLAKDMDSAFKSYIQSQLAEIIREIKK